MACHTAESGRTISEWQAKQVIFGQALEEVTALFAGKRFVFMPLKGAYLILAGMAETIDARKMADVDLLLPKEHFDAACDWFGTIEGVVERPNYWNFERSFVYPCCGHPVYFEFHRLINFSARFYLPADDLFTRGISSGRASCIFPDPVDALLVHVCHLLAHVVDGFTTQCYREMVLYSKQKAFSWNVFWERASSTGIKSFIWLVARKCSRITGEHIPTPGPPSGYAAFIDRFDLFMRPGGKLAKKILFELPFVRDWRSLLWYKMTHGRRNKRKCSFTHSE